MSELLERAWDETAGGYDDYFSPRFRPWIGGACRALPADLPPGPLGVPCCGPGQELAILRARFPARPLIGVDLSAGMLALARARGISATTLHHRDASDLSGLPPLAGLVSSFGLQQIPDPPAALAAWGRALAPGGALSVVLWQRPVEETGPFALAAELYLARSGEPDPRAGWADRLLPALAGQGFEILADARPAHTLRHAGPGAFWEAMVASGPWRAMSLRHGADFMAALRADFMAACPPGEVAHRPRARHIVARRPL